MSWWSFLQTWALPFLDQWGPAQAPRASVTVNHDTHECIRMHGSWEPSCPLCEYVCINLAIRRPHSAGNSARAYRLTLHPPSPRRARAGCLSRWGTSRLRAKEDGMVTSRDVAHLAGVSQATVSRVISSASNISPELSLIHI